VTEATINFSYTNDAEVDDKYDINATVVAGIWVSERSTPRSGVDGEPGRWSLPH